VSKEKKLMGETNEFGIPDVLVEMSNLRSNDTSLPFAIHVRSKEEVAKTAHQGNPILKVYQERPGSSPFFSMTISREPEVVPAHSKMEFYQSVSSRDLEQVKRWIIVNHGALMDFWDNGVAWFTDEKRAWEDSLKKV